MKELTLIQTELKAPKSRTNAFGKYSYRNCEDILEGIKPLLKTHNCFLTVSDEVLLIGERFYVKATATITNSEKETVSAFGFAREEDSKAGMAAAQITGSTSSYARKYALNGLLCIDDSVDTDSLKVIDGDEVPDIVVKDLAKAKTEADITKAYNKHLPKFKDATALINLCKIRKAEIANANN